MSDSKSSSSANHTDIRRGDFTASNRINYQHYIWRQELGYNIHPTIPFSSFGENPRIADVATGTGLWLLQVSRSHPRATCDGFDISLAQTPPAIWLPRNVSFFQWNMFEPPPADLACTYDLVHIRLVNLVIANKDRVSTIRNLAALLKPNGYIQWDEIDLRDTIVTHGAGDAGKVDAVRKMDGLMKGHGSFDWISKLPQHMNENGFERAMLWREKLDMGWVQVPTVYHILAFADIVSRMPGGDGRKRDFERMAADFGEVTKLRAVQGVAKVICVARKSMWCELSRSIAECLPMNTSSLT